MTSRSEAQHQPHGFLGLFTKCFHKRPRPAIKTFPQNGSSEDSSGTDDPPITPQFPAPRIPEPHRQSEKPVAVPQAVRSSAEQPATKGEDSMDKLKSRAKWLHKSKAKYFNSADSGRPHGENVQAKLDAIFDSFLDEEAKTAHASVMEIESFEAYLKQLGVSLENHEIFILLYITKATVLGKLARKDFIEGWTEAYQNDNVKPDLASQKAYFRQCMTRFGNDPDFFKQVYRHAFVTGKEESQKALEKDTAVAFWETLLGEGAARPWRSRNVNWFALWKEFLEAKWTRSVNKDMWNQTLVFADKTMADETLSFWSENDSWPGVIDDFVEWCRQGGRVPRADGMDVDN